MFDVNPGNLEAAKSKGDAPFLLRRIDLRPLPNACCDIVNPSLSYSALTQAWSETNSQKLPATNGSAEYGNPNQPSPAKKNETILWGVLFLGGVYVGH